MWYFAEQVRNLTHISSTIESEHHENATLSVSPDETQKRYNDPGYKGLGSLELHIPSSETPILVKLPDIVKPIRRTGDLKSLRVRLPLASRNNHNHELVTTPKFEAPSLGNGVPLVSQDAKVTWKPLPSDYWAELMDAWHCHKPHENGHKHEHKVTEKSSYSLALNGFHAQSGLAYYSDTHYLVHASDLSQGGSDSLSTIYKPEPPSGSVKFWKWDLGESVMSVMRPMLRELVDAHAIYTITINDTFSVWILNTHTSCIIGNTEVIPDGMKVLYADTKSSPYSLDNRPDPEFVTIPDAALNTLRNTLEGRNQRLPSRVQSMDGWSSSII